jgi:hypothetical protein
VRETPHVNQPSRTNTIINALKRRAQSILNDSSIDAQSRAIIRYALETNDPWLAELVRRADEGETVIDSAGFLKTSSTDEEKIAALADLICRGGDEAGSIGQLPQRQRFHWIVAPRSTVIQTSPVHTGRCSDPAMALEHLLAKMVDATA